MVACASRVCGGGRRVAGKSEIEVAKVLAHGAEENEPVQKDSE